jgi:hypothetical protein
VVSVIGMDIYVVEDRIVSLGAGILPFQQVT